jgi:hypothetical protein
MTEGFYCDSCNRPIDPEAAGTVAAHHQIAVPDLGTAVTKYISGRGAYFHEGCYPGDSRFLRRSPPSE